MYVALPFSMNVVFGYSAGSGKKHYQGMDKSAVHREEVAQTFCDEVSEANASDIIRCPQLGQKFSPCNF